MMQTQRASRAASRAWRVAGILAIIMAGNPAPAAAGTDRPAAAKTPPTPAAEALKTFEVHAGLRLELVAAEPLVTSPVAMAFDENGVLFVAEMVDYPEGQNKSVGRIRRLEDRDGDGIFETSAVFADRIAFPSGLACANGGLLVASVPDLLFLKDTDADGRADVRETMFTGFGSRVDFIPARVFNGFAWGLDNRYYGATSRSGGLVKRVKPGEDAAALDLKGKDFSFDPRALTLRAESGVAQFGVTFDDYGRRFLCSNSNHVMMVMYEHRYGARNPFHDLPRPLLDIPVDGPAARVFRISPEESWRVTRTQWRMSGKARGPTEGGHTSGYFTSAGGVTVYRGAALPANFNGDVFVAEPTNNLVHRKKLRADGVALAAFRPDDERETEFLRSRDTWFRPVNFANGPDGALYIADMYRELIEEPISIPGDIVKDFVTGEGSDRGRIYRVVAAGFRRPKTPALSAASTAGLVAGLENPNGWHRDTAARLLYERQDTSCVPALTRLAQSSNDPVARIRALYALTGLGRLTAEALLLALADPQAEVREHAVRLAESQDVSAERSPAANGAPSPLRRRLLALARDPAPRVRYQLAFTLGELARGEDATEALLQIAVAGLTDPWQRAAVLSSLQDNTRDFFLRATRPGSLLASAEGREFLGQVIAILGARGGGEEMAAAVQSLSSWDEKEAALLLLSRFQSGLKRGGHSLSQADPTGKLLPILQTAADIARDRGRPEAARLGAIQLLAADRTAAAGALLVDLLQPHESQKIQLEAVTALGSREGNPAPSLMEGWRGFTPRVREQAMKILAARPERALTVLATVRAGKLRPADFSAGQVQLFENHPNARVRQQAAGVFVRASEDRRQVIAAFAGALKLEPDAARGKAVFGLVCAPCHRLEGVGFELGPSLLGVQAHGKESVLEDILDPNRKIDPAHRLYQVETRTAGMLVGAVADETATSITVKQAWGNETVVPRNSIVKLQSQEQSMMPEGLEKAVGSSQAMADLLEYIQQAR